MKWTTVTRWTALIAILCAAVIVDYTRATEVYELSPAQPWMFWAGDSARIGWYSGSRIVAYPNDVDTTGNGTSLTAVVADSSYRQDDWKWATYDIWEYWATGSTLLVDDYFMGTPMVPPGAHSPDSTYDFGYIDVGVATADYLTVIVAATCEELTVLNPPYFNTDTLTVEGATADAYESRLYFTDPTAERIFTFPNSSQTIGTATSLSGIASAELDDIVSNTKTAGNIWIANGTTGFESKSTTGIAFTAGGVGSVTAAGYDALMVAHAHAGTYTLAGVSNDTPVYRWALYSAGLTTSDIVVVSWAPDGDGNDYIPVNAGTGARDMTVGAWCKVDSIIFMTSGLYAAGDSLVNYIVIPQ